MIPKRSNSLKRVPKQIAAAKQCRVKIHLPCDILLHILFADQVDLSIAPLVCKRWNQFIHANLNMFWKRLCIYYWPIFDKFPFVQKNWKLFFCAMLNASPMYLQAKQKQLQLAIAKFYKEPKTALEYVANLNSNIAHLQSCLTMLQRGVILSVIPKECEMQLIRQCNRMRDLKQDSASCEWNQLIVGTTGNCISIVGNYASEQMLLRCVYNGMDDMVFTRNDSVDENIKCLHCALMYLQFTHLTICEVWELIAEPWQNALEILQEDGDEIAFLLECVRV